MSTQIGELTVRKTHAKTSGGALPQDYGGDTLRMYDAECVFLFGDPAR